MASQSKKTRVAFVILFLLLIVVGTVLVLFPKTAYSTSTVYSQTPTCTRNFLNKLAPNQTLSRNCNAIVGNWFTLSLGSKGNLTVSVWMMTDGNSSSPTLVFNETSVSFYADFPLTESGSLQIVVNNSQNSFNSIGGYVSTFVEVESPLTVPMTLHPYQDIGYALIGIFLIAFVFLIWNPRGMATQSLDTVMKRIRKKPES